jgi:hypothetical protein
MHSARVWLPFPFEQGARRYRISFRVGEEATWDHRFHDLNGREIAAEALRLGPGDLHAVQARCDRVVGAVHARTIPD